jgi:hypothetical protein
MKKCYYFLLVLVFLFTNESSYSQIKIGLQIGPNFASGTYSSDYYKNTEVSGKIGLLAGFLAEFKLSDMFYIQPEINYLQKGVELSPLYYYYTSTATAYEITGSKGDFKLDFIEIPINVIAKFGKDQWKPFLFAGPGFSFLTTAEKTENYSVYGDVGPYSIKDYVEKVDVALNLGGGVEYAVNPKLDIFAMLRYSISLTDLFKEGTVTYNNYTYDYGDIEKFKTTGLAIGIGFKYCISGCEPEAVAPVIEEIKKTPIGRVPVKEFDLAKYDIPFYVSGYYRPNTQQSLDELFVLREGDLKNATYIEKFEKKSQRYDQYKLWAQSVDNIFHVVYTSAVDEIFPKINAANNPDEVLEISVTGYSDPRAITGKYWEPEVIQFQDSDGKIHMVKQGDDLDNLKLSGLRAYHCAKLLDKLFSESSSLGKSDYDDLKKDGKIRYKYIGAGVAKDEANLEAQRRIKITMVRTDK